MFGHQLRRAFRARELYEEQIASARQLTVTAGGLGVYSVSTTSDVHISDDSSLFVGILVPLFLSRSLYNFVALNNEDVDVWGYKWNFLTDRVCLRLDLVALPLICVFLNYSSRPYPLV